MVVGYARVSTKGQAKDGNSLAVQEELLKANGVEKIYSESFTGTKLDRPELNRLLSDLSSGDVVIVTKLDRIARSVRGGLEIIDTILTKGCTIQILNLGTFDDSPTGKLTRTIMLAFAEFERDMIVQRTQEGKALAKQDSNFTEGRPPKYNHHQLDLAMRLLGENTYKEVSLQTGISVSTLHRERRKRAAEREDPI